MRRLLISFILLALMLIGGPVGAEAPQQQLGDVEVLSVSPRPLAGSGISAVFWWFTGRIGDRQQKFFSFFLGNEVFPVVGDRCTVTYHIGAPPGIEGVDGMAATDVWMIDKLVCRHADGTPSSVKTNL